MLKHTFVCIWVVYESVALGTVSGTWSLPLWLFPALCCLAARRWAVFSAASWIARIVVGEILICCCSGVSLPWTETLQPWMNLNIFFFKMYMSNILITATKNCLMQSHKLESYLEVGNWTREYLTIPSSRSSSMIQWTLRWFSGRRNSDIFIAVSFN